ncbi:MAG: hypothetical protein ABJO02_20060 [Reichenbachiella sp.]|uniref:hypothetical protein n=1 Tax=Reichenbachiella sp. TaxID=2184521 RepID=UPI00329927C4
MKGMKIRVNNTLGYIVKTLSFFVLITLSLSCTYEFDDIKKAEINIEDHAEITNIELEFDEDDTVKIFELTDLHYDLTGHGYRNVDVTVTVDDQVIHTSYGAQGNFRVRTQPAVNSIHQMVLTATINSGTGSLLDRLDGEKIVYQKNWVLSKKGRYPKPLNLRVLNDSGGILELVWDKYLERNFVEYRISVTPYEKSYGQIKYHVADPNINRLEIPHYIGGGAQIWFNVIAEGAGPQHSVLQVEDEGVAFNKFEYLDGDLKIYWTKSKYHQTFDSYQICSDSDGENLIYATNDINDTTYVLTDYKFGAHTNIFLSAVPKDLPSYNLNSFKFDLKNVFAGDTALIGHHSYLYPSESISNFYYGLKHYDYDIYNIQSTEKIDYEINRNNNTISDDFQERARFDVTPDGRTIVLVSGYSNTVHVLDTNQEIVKSIPAYEITGNYSDPILNISIDNNDMMLMKSSTQNQLYTYDLDKEMLIDTLTAEVANIYGPEINNPGTYVKWYYYGQTYGTPITNGEFGTTVEIEGKYPLFSPNGDELYSFSGESIFIYSTTGGGLLRSETWPSAKKLRYVDHNTGYISWVSSDKVFYVYDPATSQLLHQSNVAVNEVRYFNGYAISNYGYSLLLDL